MKILPDVFVLLGGGPGMCVSYLRKGLEPYKIKCPLVSYQHLGASGPEGNRPLPSNFTMEDFVEDLKSFLKSQPYKKIGFITHSWGTYLALEYISQYPEDISHLVFISPPPFTKKEYMKGTQHLLGKISPTILKELENLNDQNDPYGFTMMQFLNPFYVENPIPKAENLFYYNDRRGNQIMEQQGDFNYSEIIKHLRENAHIIVGEKDPFWVPGGAIHQLEKLNPNLTISVIPNVGHYPFFEDPKAFRKVLVKQGLCD